MLDLLLSILFTNILFVVFKFFDRFEIDNLQAITVNYFIAFTLGYWHNTSSISINTIPEKPWFIGAFFLGFLFIIVFNAMAVTTQKIGISVVSVSSKLSLVIPVVFAYFVYEEPLNIYRVIGLIIALLSVYFVSVKETITITNRNLILFPVLIFLGSGVIDTSLKFIEDRFVKPEELPIYTGTIFLVAGILGTLLTIYQQIKLNKKTAIRNVIAGIILGIPNYYSVYYLLKALKMEGLDSGVVFTINNVAIVLVSTLIGMLAFKEKISKKNAIGIILAIIAIVLIFQSTK